MFSFTRCARVAHEPRCRRAVAAHLVACAVCVAAAAWQRPAAADESGVSFWLPGQFGSLAAVPATPGLQIPMFYYHDSVSAGGGATFQRGGRIVAGVGSQADLFFIVPTLVFEPHVAGAQASIGMGVAFGTVGVDIHGTLTGPRGRELTGEKIDSRTGASDLYPSAALKWTHGAHNAMLYTMGGLPAGTYDADRLANVGTGHFSIDGGAGYTYFDKKHEFSAVAGVTAPFENEHTDYRNGVSAHVDWAASWFLFEFLHVGAVGYGYQQLSGDSGSGAKLGDFRSSVYAIGGELGLFFPVLGEIWYLNVKGYGELFSQHRPDGWNGWATLVLPLPSASPEERAHAKAAANREAQRAE